MPNVLLMRKGNPLNVGSLKEAKYAHAITHSPTYIKGIGLVQAKKEHHALVEILKKGGVKHFSAFK